MDTFAKSWPSFSDSKLNPSTETGAVNAAPPVSPVRVAGVVELVAGAGELGKAAAAGLGLAEDVPGTERVAAAVDVDVSGGRRAGAAKLLDERDTPRGFSLDRGLFSQAHTSAKMESQSSLLKGWPFLVCTTIPGEAFRHESDSSSGGGKGSGQDRTNGSTSSTAQMWLDRSSDGAQL